MAEKLNTTNILSKLDEAAVLLQKFASAENKSFDDYIEEGKTTEVPLEVLDEPIDTPELDTDTKLKPNLAYEKWVADKNEDNFVNVLNALRPTIKYALASNNAIGDPLIETKAKVLASKAIKSYDPSYGTGLPTYVTSQLQKLTRYTRDARSPIRIPERQMYAAAELAKTEEEWKEKHGGKEPTVSDLADELGLPIKAIEKIRKQFIKQVSEGAYFAGKTEEDDISSAAEQGKAPTDFTKEALNYVYNDLGYRDKKILEYTTGFGGSDILSPKEISKKLNISQSQISRISAKLANRMFDIKQTLERVYNSK